MRTPRNVLVQLSGNAAAAHAILRGVVALVKQRRLPWQVRCTDADVEPALRRDGPWDGASDAVREAAAAGRLRRSRRPVVNLLHDLHEQIPSVLSDEKMIGRAGAAALMRLGFRHFAFLGIDARWSEGRRAGFAAALRAAGFQCDATDPRLRLEDYVSSDEGPRVAKLRRWVRQLPPAVAVMACSDFVANSLLLACREAGRRVPDDAAVLGVDNDAVACELAPVPLSSIEQNFEAIGFRAAAVLERVMAGGRPPTRPVLVPPGRLVARKSTDAFGFDDAAVAEAMRLIHRLGPAGASVKEILGQLAVSRAWLDRRMKELVGRSPGEELRRLRLDHVKELLQETSLPVAEVARSCGYSHVQSLSRSFRDAFGATPLEYREKNREARPASRKLQW